MKLLDGFCTIKTGENRFSNNPKDRVKRIERRKDLTRKMKLVCADRPKLRRRAMVEKQSFKGIQNKMSRLYEHRKKRRTNTSRRHGAVYFQNYYSKRSM
jgi:hypothetical protein